MRACEQADACLLQLRHTTPHSGGGSGHSSGPQADREAPMCVRRAVCVCMCSRFVRSLAVNQTRKHARLRARSAVDVFQRFLRRFMCCAVDVFQLLPLLLLLLLLLLQRKPHVNCECRCELMSTCERTQRTAAVRSCLRRTSNTPNDSRNNAGCSD